MGGFSGKFLEVDLSKGTSSEQSFDEEVYKKYLGGLGLGARYLYKEHSDNEDLDALGPENTLGFVPGLLNGVDLPLCGRMSVVSKSPLTHTWGDCNVGGFFGTELKEAGYDAIFIKGVSDNPVYLDISDEGSQILDASELWGKDTQKTKRAIEEKEEKGEDVKVASIGPSGEKESLISSIIFGDNRAAARSGLGAVMGSKNLKAVAVKGNKSNQVEIENQNRFNEAKEEVLERLSKEPSRFVKLMRKLIQPIMPWLLRRGVLGSADKGTVIKMFKDQGTAMATAMSTEMGDAPCKNWKASGPEVFPYKEALEIGGENIIQYQYKDYACATCVIGCGGRVSVEQEPFKVEEAKKPEYETLASFGSMSLNNDVESIIKCNEVCDKYGLDTISTGSAVAFAIECFEEGIISKEDLGGMELTWGNEDAIVELTEMIAERKGIGDVLADGVKEAAKEIGDGAEKYAMHVHGQEVPMHDPRLNPSFATAYVADPTPARHTKGGAGHLEFGMTPNSFKEIEVSDKSKNKGKEKAKEKVRGEVHAESVKVQVLLDSLGICFFLGYLGNFPFLKALNAVNDWELTRKDILETGERIQTTRQAYNIREGLKRSDFSLPDRIKGKPPLEKGPTKDVTLDVDKMVGEYYTAMGWNDEGVPTKKKLKELSLKDVASELHQN
ncbi:hypothetical protein C9439_04430 [archaeon SCG-AAA382B04]|nr:hypothetical protein C9439_04430 [archaeon SCG-AAA382B04]